MPAKQGKHWCFTTNNYTNENKDQLKTLSETVSYLVYGEEVGESGTQHLQGFISYYKRVTFNKVKKDLPDGSHIEQAKGTPAQAATYCKKDDSYTEFGVLPTGQGTRTDIAAVQDAIKRGATKSEIRDEFFGTYCRYERAIQGYISDVQQRRNWVTTVIVLWGEAGTGKTRSVYDYHKPEDIYMHTGEKWFDGYEGQKIALFDDYNGGEFKLTYLLKLIDRYPFQVPVKGGYRNWIPQIIYFTSNKDPMDWYTNATEVQKRALKRRFTRVRHIS